MKKNSPNRNEDYSWVPKGTSAAGQESGQDNIRFPEPGLRRSELSESDFVQPVAQPAGSDRPRRVENVRHPQADRAVQRTATSTGHAGHRNQTQNPHNHAKRAAATSAKVPVRRHSASAAERKNTKLAADKAGARAAAKEHYVTKKKGAMLIASLSVLFVLMLVATLYSYLTGNYRQVPNGRDSGLNTQGKAMAKSPTPVPVPPAAKEKVRNILLIGSDLRENESNAGGQRSDTMILLTLNFKEKAIKLTSFQRDMLTYIKGDPDDLERLNASYNYGPQGVLDTINSNFALDVQDFMAVRMEGVARIVDLMHGVHVDVPDNENFIDAMNDCIREQNDLFNEQEPMMTHGGDKMLLNGTQALAYVRVRKVDSDFMRSDRQKELINLLVEKFRKLDPVAQAALVRQGLAYIESNLSIPEMLDLMQSTMQNVSGDVQEFRIPMEGTYWIDENYDILPALNLSAAKLHQIIYGDMADQLPRLLEVPGAPKVEVEMPYVYKPDTERFSWEMASMGFSDEETESIARDELERQRKAGYVG